MYRLTDREILDAVRHTDGYAAMVRVRGRLRSDAKLRGIYGRERPKSRGKARRRRQASH